MKKPIKVLLIVLACMVLLVAAGVVFMSLSTQKLNAITQMKIDDVDLSVIANGTYEGEYSAFPITAKVSVTVRDHEIVRIDLLKHFNGQGGAADAIPEKVVKAQSLQVDAVSGATYSSKVILLAIQNALINANPVK